MYKQLDPNFAYRVFTGGPLITIFTKNEKDIPDGTIVAGSPAKILKRKPL